MVIFSILLIYMSTNLIGRNEPIYVFVGFPILILALFMVYSAIRGK